MTAATAKTAKKPAAKKGVRAPYGPPVTEGLRKMSAHDRDQHARTTTEFADLWALAADPSKWVRDGVISNPNTPGDILTRILDRSEDRDKDYNSFAVLVHPNCPKGLRQRLALRTLNSEHATRTYGYGKNSRWHKAIEVLGLDSLTPATLTKLNKEWRNREFVVQFTTCPQEILAAGLDTRTSDYQTENVAAANPALTAETFRAVRDAVVSSDDSDPRHWASVRMQRLTKIYNEAHPETPVEPLEGVNGYDDRD